MRKSDVAAAAAKQASVPSDGAEDAPVQLVCLALVLALVALACRIASVW